MSKKGLVDTLVGVRVTQSPSWAVASSDDVATLSRLRCVIDVIDLRGRCSVCDSVVLASHKPSHFFLHVVRRVLLEERVEPGRVVLMGLMGVVSAE